MNKDNEAVKERVQKLMAQAGIGSRRACEEIISQGRVRVNGKVIHLGDQADSATDLIEVDGVRLKVPERKLYIAFYKPRNVLSTDDPHEGDTRRTARDFLPFEEHLFSAGRLDADSEGLMVLTNDGELANRLTHPRYRHTKTYKVVVVGLPSRETIEHWEHGVLLEEEDGTTEMTIPCSVKVMDGGKVTSTLRIVMTEGKKRQIRRVAVQLGHPVRSLIRTHIGKFGLGTLHPGEWRELTAEDIQALKTPSEDLHASGRKTSGRRPSRAGAHADKRPSRPRSPAGGNRSRSRPAASRHTRKKGR
jgi:pseudouridine synthase